MRNSTDPSFIVFSDDWGEHPSSCQHLFRQIGREHEVLWVNTIGMRNPKLNRTDLMKAGYKIRKMLLGDRRKSDGCGGRPSRLSVYQPPMLPFSGSGWVESYNRHVVTRGVRGRVRKPGPGPILVTTVPNAADYIGYCGESRVVYYCVDDFGNWPGLDHERVRKKESALISRTDIFVATSWKLFQKLSRHGKPVFLLTHGVDLELFGRPVAAEHPLLKPVPKPRVGYFGLFDKRTDPDLLGQVAVRSPGISFVITGRVEADVSRLKGISNIYFTGPVPYDELPAMVHGWDACFLAYVRSSLTDSISPLKLKEYLATGKPVICTPLPEARMMGLYLRLAETVGDWVKHLEEVASGERPDRTDQVLRANWLERESWKGKAEAFYQISAGIIPGCAAKIDLDGGRTIPSAFSELEWQDQ